MKDIDKTLIDSLQMAVDASASETCAGSFLQPYPWSQTNEGKSFLQKINEVESLNIFEGSLQSLGNSASAVDRLQLAHRMVARAKLMSTKQAVEEVDHYIHNDSFDAYQVMLLSGLYVDSEHDLGGGIWLIPSSQIPNSRLRECMGYTPIPIPDISCALICNIQLQKLHTSQIKRGDEDKFTRSEELEKVQVAQQALEDARLCLTLMRSKGCGVQGIASTTVAGDNVPILASYGGWSIHPYLRPGFEASMIGIEAHTVKDLFSKFAALDPSDQDHLRIPMQKLNESAACLSAVQQTIALRTALESLFLNDDVNTEQNYRLGLRAAVFVGGDIADRKKVQQKVKQVYEFCSKSVHTGRIPTKHYNFNVMGWARELIRDALCELINSGSGKPDWSTVELTGGVVVYEDKQGDRDPN